MIDHSDAQLLNILQEDGRITLSELSKKLNLSRPSVRERLNRLQEQGVIEGISARVSYPKVGRHIISFIQMSDMKVPYATFENFAAENSDILECHRITGAISYMLKAAVKDMNHLEILIDELVNYGIVNTSIVVKSPTLSKIVVPIVGE